ncbi:MAG: Hsp20/alpha crystallin family protein [Ktedonobacteraceae bacterium]|nr:Hsp20/alpha crystallin family protein [Ktedonobacteraceae bacterium]
MQEKEKVQHVPVKVYRSTDRLMVAVPLPGMEPGDIHVQVSPEAHLLIQGEIRGLLKDIKELLIDEWSVGGYRRELDLPTPVDASQANVTYRNGVLVIAFPVSSRTTAANLALSKKGVAYGQYSGLAGHPSS